RAGGGGGWAVRAPVTGGGSAVPGGPGRPSTATGTKSPAASRARATASAPARRAKRTRYFLKRRATSGAEAAAAAPRSAARTRAFFLGSMPFHSRARRVIVRREEFEALPSAFLTVAAPCPEA